MRLRIGNQTSFAASRVTEPFEYALASGFDAFEWFPDRRESGQGWAEEDLSKDLRAWIREESRQHGISLSLHAPWSTNPLRESSREALRKNSELAIDIGAGLLNLHLSPEDGIEPFADSIVPFAGMLSRESIALSVENTVHTGPEDFNRLFVYLRDRHPKVLSAIGMCFDLGHANLYGPTRNDYLSYFDRLDPDLPLIHVHLHENFGDADSHLPLFTGPSLKDDSGLRGLLERLRKRSFTGSIILEHWPHPPSLLLQARQRLLSLMGDDPVTPAGHRGGFGGDLAARIADASRRHRSWRNRLNWVHQVLTDSSCPPDRDTLAHMAVYLRFIGTGALPCAEDGGHYRPSHHARTSAQIYETLLGLKSTDRALLIRKIIPWLPSFDGTFTHREPLTRIRDIAHRNDIPKELKSEIKHTLQNKLHRSAGPEDLSTSAAILERITQPGAEYSPSFVEAFKLFHEELKEFFNARSLEERLERLAPGAETAVAQAIRRFLASKNEAAGAASPDVTLGLLTDLRAHISRTLPAEASAERIEWHLADVALEEYCFVVLSRLVNSLESAQRDISLIPSPSRGEGVGGGVHDPLSPSPSSPPLQGGDHGYSAVSAAESLIPTHRDVHWQGVLTSLGLAVENLRLSGLDAAECSAIESELKAWTKDFNPVRREDALRLKATLSRCRRLSERYTDTILSLLPETAEKLGAALGVSEQARRVYAESDIRGHPVFQLTRLAGFIEKNLPGLKGRALWDVIVPGASIGHVLCARDLPDLILPGRRPVIAVLRAVSGDEEIPPQVRGLVVAHETPRLSHLAIRARQAGVVFAACRDPEQFSQIWALHGSHSALHAVGDEVRIETSSSGGDGQMQRPSLTSFTVPRTAPRNGSALLDLIAVAPETCGAKASALRRLSELSEREEAGFSALPAVVVPFGVMEEALSQSPDLHREYLSLLDGANGESAPVSRETLHRLRSLIGRLDVPDKITGGVIARFGTDAALVVRSSANTEDIEGYSSAGLYESLLNVKPPRVAEALRGVWSSLWTDRAAASRVSSGIPHGDVRMAVIIQAMAAADYAFVMNTRNPFSGNPDEAYIEIVVGLGETLASAKVAGTPYRLLYDRKSGQAVTLDLASFSTAAQPLGPEGSEAQTLDYSRIALSRDDRFRIDLAERLGRASVFLERAFGRPQDIEGLVSGNKLYIVQSRPQYATPHVL
jgi:phosphoglucan,water dikinase